MKKRRFWELPIMGPWHCDGIKADQSQKLCVNRNKIEFSIPNSCSVHFLHRPNVAHWLCRISIWQQIIDFMNTIKKRWKNYQNYDNPKMTVRSF